MAGNTHWNEANLAVLKRLGKQGKLAEAAKLFNCTENAVRIKYGRITRATSFSDKIDAIVKTSAKKLDLKTNNKPLFKAISIQKPGQKNPFEITQAEFTGSKTTPEVVLLLVKQMLNIKANKLDCIIVPLSVADTKKRASNIFQQAKNYLAKTNKAEMVFTIKSTFSGDAEKKYLGGRIWRLK